MVALGLAASAGAARPGVIREFALGSSQRVYLFGLTTGADGAVWFADLGCAGLGRCGIGRIDSAGRVTVYTRGLNAGSVPFQIALGPDGNLWFTDEGSRPAIGRITPRGRITVFAHGLRRASVPFGIAADRHGLWFTDHGCAGSGRCQLGRVTVAGRIAEGRHGLRSDTIPLAMAAGFGGSVWFADGAGSIGEIAAGGHVSEHALPAGSAPVGIGAGADGNMWFTDEGSSPVIGRVSPTGAVRTFSAGLEHGSLPAAIAPARP